MKGFKHISLVSKKLSNAYWCEPVSIGYGTEDGSTPYTYDNRYRDEFSLFQFTLDGEGIFHEGDKPEIVLKKGEGFIVNSPSNTSYYLPEGRRWTFIYILYKGDIARYHTAEIIKNFGHVIKMPVASLPIELLKELFSEASNKRIPDTFTLSSFLYRFLMELYKELHKSESDNKQDDILLVVRMVEAHYGDASLSLNHFAKEACLSPFHFLRKFKKVIGLSPRKYLLKTRIQKASDLLLSTNLTVKEICAKVGFTEPSYFCAVFKKYKKISPEAYRKNVHIQSRKG